MILIASGFIATLIATKRSQFAAHASRGDDGGD